MKILIEVEGGEVKRVQLPVAFAHIRGIDTVAVVCDRDLAEAEIKGAEVACHVFDGALKRNEFKVVELKYPGMDGSFEGEDELQ